MLKSRVVSLRVLWRRVDVTVLSFYYCRLTMCKASLQGIAGKAKELIARRQSNIINGIIRASRAIFNLGRVKRSNKSKVNQERQLDNLNL